MPCALVEVADGSQGASRGERSALERTWNQDLGAMLIGEERVICKEVCSANRI